MTPRGSPAPTQEARAARADRCSEVDALNDFVSFSVSGPFFNWLVVGGYYPKVFDARTEQESRIFSAWSTTMIRGALVRLKNSARFEPFMLGEEPCLPDFHLFQVLRAAGTVSALLDIPFMNLLEGDETLRRFDNAMAARASTQEILAAQEKELPLTRQELFRDFAPAYEKILKPGRAALRAMFGREI